MFEVGGVGEWRSEGLSGAEQVLAACVDAASAALVVAARVDTAGMDGGFVAGVVLGLERARRVLDAAEAHGLAALDAGGWSDRVEGLATSRWLARDAGLPAGVARRRLVVANRLGELPEAVDDAYSAGELGAEHVGVLADGVNDRNVDAFSEGHLDRVLDSAGSAVFSAWQRSTRRVLQRLDPDGAASRDHDDVGDTLRLSPSDRFTMVRGELTGANAALTREALESVADELFRDWARECSVNPELVMPSRAQLLAQALVEVCRRARAVELGSSRPGRSEVVLTVHDDDPELAWSRWGDTYLTGSLSVLLCDCSLRRLVLDAEGVPLDMGRAVRAPTPAQRRALDVRDGGCTFPGCGAHLAWCDAHHLRRWADHGASDLDNMVLLCRRHHGIAHRNGWHVELSTHGWTRWRTPDQRHMWGQRHHTQHAGPAP